jgi:hypothetical protein
MAGNQSALCGLGLVSPSSPVEYRPLNALRRILYRASQVIRKPTDELISILGIEVPLPPTLSLAGIKADGFVLHWKTAEQKNAAIQYRLYVNGVNGKHHPCTAVHS